MEQNGSSGSHRRQGWSIKPAADAMRIKNPIRDIVDQLKVPKDATKPLISLSIGSCEFTCLQQTTFFSVSIMEPLLSSVLL
jgi:hypothetical protein